MKEGACKRGTNAKIAQVYKLNSVCQAMPGDDVGFDGVLDKYGPFLVGIAAVGTFGSYSGGVYTDAESCGQDVNHAVVVVGYGVDNSTGLKYWLIKVKKINF